MMRFALLLLVVQLGETDRLAARETVEARGMGAWGARSSAP